MDFAIISYIAGIASLLGLILQLIDAFPEYREVRKTVFLIVLGVFIGTILGSLQAVSIKLDSPLSAFHIIIAISVLIISSVAIIGAFTNDHIKRVHIFTASCVGLIALLIVLFGNAVSTIQIGQHDITKDELMILANNNLEKGDVDRAIIILDMVKNQLNLDDPRRKLLDKKINELKNKN